MATVQPQTEPLPWWLRRSGPAVVFVAVTVIGFAFNLVVPLLSANRISDKQRQLEQQIARGTQQVENLSRKVEVSRLLFDHYFGKSASEQRAVITYLKYQFPRDITTKSIQAILFTEGKPEVRADVTQSVAAVQQVTTSALKTAVQQERSGFSSLIAGDLTKAYDAFRTAYTAYPTYHNVDEITRRVLTPEIRRKYSKASPAGRGTIVDAVASTILKRYSWGMPGDLRAGLERQAGS